MYICIPGQTEVWVCPPPRYLVSPDQSLQLHYVTLQDAGRYTCTAVNDIGAAVASAHLIVEGESTHTTTTTTI